MGRVEGGPVRDAVDGLLRLLDPVPVEDALVLEPKQVAPVLAEGPHREVMVDSSHSQEFLH